MYQVLKLHSVICFLFLVTGLIATGPSFAAGVRVPGTKVSIQPPVEFSAATQFPGFLHSNSGSSIMITEIPGPVAEVGAGMNKDGLASRGMQLLEKGQVVVGGQKAQLLKIRQYVANAEYLKWLLLFGDESASILVVGTFPASVDSSIGTQIKDAIQTARWDKNAKPGFFDGLAFRIGESDELKFAKRISGMVLLSRQGEFGKARGGRPLLVAGSAISQARIENMEVFSRQRVLQTAQMVDITVVEGRYLTINGLDAYELVADARDSEDNLDMTLYQVIVPQDSSYLIVQGMVGKLNSKRYLKQFRQVANSLRLNDG